MTGAANSVLGAVERYSVPKSVLKATVAELHATGGDKHEAFVLWGGQVSDDGCSLAVISALRPAQTASRSDDGLLVVVEGDALFAVNKRLYERGELLVGQVHTHPSDAYHSPTDDDYPLVTLVGALSLVIPDFGRAGVEGRARWAWYRLQAIGDWRLLDPDLSIEIT